jgi:hypothetical protein
MSFPPKKPFNPVVSKTPILGPSSGNPASFQDPNSVASIGSKIQAMSDQAAADTLYDTPPPKREGFRNEIYSPWILNTEACRKEGFSSVILSPDNYRPLLLVILGVGAILYSFSKKK